MRQALKKVGNFFNLSRWESNRQSINRQTFFGIPSAADAAKEFTPGDRKQMLRLGRYLRDNLGVTAGLIPEMSRYSVGTDLLINSATEDSTWDELADKSFYAWCQVADVQGRFSLGQMVDMWCQSMLCDGEVFPVMRMVDDMPRIQTIYAHAVEGSDDRWVDGILYDKNGRPRAYRLTSGQRLPASVVMHIMEPRPNRLRGVPGIAHAANNLFDLRDILSFEKQGVKLNSAIAVVLKKQLQGNTTGNRFIGRGSESISGDDILTLESIVGGGNVPSIGPNDSLDVHRSDKTSTTFQGFLEWLIRDTAIGFGVPYEFAWNAEKMSGTAQRFVMAKAQRRFSQIQYTFSSHLKKIRAWYIATEIEAGRLPANPEFDSCEIIWPKKATVDFGRESREEREDVAAGLRTLRDHFGDKQKDWRKELAQIAEEKKLIQDLGIENLDTKSIDNPDTIDE